MPCLHGSCRIQGRRRDDLDALLQTLGINAANPVTVMTQDTARSFLAGAPKAGFALCRGAPWQLQTPHATQAGFRLCALGGQSSMQRSAPSESLRQRLADSHAAVDRAEVGAVHAHPSMHPLTLPYPFPILQAAARLPTARSGRCTWTPHSCRRSATTWSSAQRRSDSWTRACTRWAGVGDGCMWKGGMAGHPGIRGTSAVVSLSLQQANSWQVQKDWRIPEQKGTEEKLS
jgi:hypothetical protein